jgi:hypothetical protein
MMFRTVYRLYVMHKNGALFLYEQAPNFPDREKAEEMGKRMNEARRAGKATDNDDVIVLPHVLAAGLRVGQ